MSYYGNTRKRPLMDASGPDRAGTKPPVMVHIRKVIVFEYLGEYSMTVIGAATGIKYRFSRSGARVIIDPADLKSLAAVPELRQV